MHLFKTASAAASFALSVFVVTPLVSQELPSIYPGVTTLGERTIPAPVGLSPEMLEVVKERQIPPFIPAPNNTDDWLEFQAMFDKAGVELGLAAVAHNEATYEVKDIAGVRTYVVTPKKVNDRWGDRVFVHIHGGAWVFGGGDSALREAVWAASGLGVKVISVDYRRPPLHPFPAAIEDSVAVWQEILKTQDNSQTALIGTSAGGNISLGTVLRLKELGLPLPGAIFAGTPSTDLQNISDTWRTLEGLDPLGARKEGGVIQGAIDLYVGTSDPSNPLLSPINGNLNGFPPTILISGTRDILLSDTVRMHRALRGAGVTADLHVYDGQAHADYMQNLLRPVPEATDAQRELYEFFDRHLK
ncbi:alpha/beta hydrolase fold domain-containing protein [Rhodobacteraceae bacterium CY05]|uniref:Alpha/beta hydrolase fold domain-containing protein n=2 Tax=Parasedimentitalea huanghaiensis TaxID=2682100 RepID=A0A6L6WCK9_9RHOB|nr:alpha/beta hydrolase fold domain-containing protein [Zongyanglinia huanghaiensis]